VHRGRALMSFVVFAMAAIFSLGALANAQNADCKILYDAAVLQARTPSHIYSTMTGSSGNVSMETISTNDSIYMKVGNQWKKSAYSPQEEAKEAADRGRSYTDCQHIGDEAVNGEAAGIYTEVKKESEMTGKVWISKKRGLPLKGDVTTGGGHISIRYDYDNIRPPAGAQ
jgi:hypothetical protein